MQNQQLAQEPDSLRKAIARAEGEGVTFARAFYYPASKLKPPWQLNTIFFCSAECYLSLQRNTH